MGGRGIGRAFAALVVAGAGLFLAAGNASAGSFDIVTCLGDADHWRTDAFVGQTNTPRMKVVRQCDP
jgi:hypothetical protein